MTCTFFGHRLVPAKFEPTLRSVLIDLIENHDVNRFYVGNQGDFDAMVRRVLKDLSKRYDITYSVALAYMPSKKTEYAADPSDTVLPEGIENVPRRFAISFRNKWMIARADYVVTYVTHEIGSGAAQFKTMAQKKGKTVIELSDTVVC